MRLIILNIHILIRKLDFLSNSWITPFFFPRVTILPTPKWLDDVEGHILNYITVAVSYTIELIYSSMTEYGLCTLHDSN